MSDLPEMKPVESSNIKAIGYDAAKRHLHVQFKSGGHYRYEDVAPHIHADFMAADSKGSHFASNLAGKFVHQKVQ